MKSIGLPPTLWAEQLEHENPEAWGVSRDFWHQLVGPINGLFWFSRWTGGIGSILYKITLQLAGFFLPLDNIPGIHSANAPDAFPFGDYTYKSQATSWPPSYYDGESWRFEASQNIHFLQKNLRFFWRVLETSRLRQKTSIMWGIYVYTYILVYFHEFDFRYNQSHGLFGMQTTHTIFLKFTDWFTWEICVTFLLLKSFLSKVENLQLNRERGGEGPFRIKHLTQQG